MGKKGLLDIDFPRAFFLCKRINDEAIV